MVVAQQAHSITHSVTAVTITTPTSVCTTYSQDIMTQRFADLLARIALYRFHGGYLLYESDPKPSSKNRGETASDFYTRTDQQHLIKSPPIHSQQQSAQMSDEQISQPEQPPADEVLYPEPKPLVRFLRVSLAIVYSSFSGSWLAARSKYLCAST